MYAWEPSFMKRIQAIRNSEINCLWKYALYTATTIVFAVHSPFMVAISLVQYLNFFLKVIYIQSFLLYYKLEDISRIILFKA